MRAVLEKHFSKNFLELSRLLQSRAHDEGVIEGKLTYCFSPSRRMPMPFVGQGRIWDGQFYFGLLRREQGFQNHIERSSNQILMSCDPVLIHRILSCTKAGMGRGGLPMEKFTDPSRTLCLDLPEQMSCQQMELNWQTRFLDFAMELFKAFKRRIKVNRPFMDRTGFDRLKEQLTCQVREEFPGLHLGFKQRKGSTLMICVEKKIPNFQSGIERSKLRVLSIPLERELQTNLFLWGNPLNACLMELISSFGKELSECD